MTIEQWEKDADEIVKYYTNQLKGKGYTYEAIAARDEKYSTMFFEAQFSDTEINSDTTFLDIGSGLGLLIPFLASRGIDPADYIGIDLIEPFVNYSKNTYPNYNFIKGNFLSKNCVIDKKYDCVVALGVMVSRVSAYEVYLKEFINKMVKYSNKYVLFNLITEIDTASPNYSDTSSIGGITPIDRVMVDTILASIDCVSYEIIEKRIFEDATDAFVRIVVK